MEILRKASEKGSYLKFTSRLRYWLYKTLRDYIRNLSLKQGVPKTTDLTFSRSDLQITGYVSVDVYSFVLKQLEERR